MWKNILKEDGSSLITVMAITTIISATLLIILSYLLIQTKHLHSKENYLTAKYNSEAGIYVYLSELEKYWHYQKWMRPVNRTININPKDSVLITAYPWGSFIHLESYSQKKDQSFKLRTYIGLNPSAVFNSSVVLNPKYSPVVLTGNTKIYGDMRTGKHGVKKGTLAGKPFTGSKLVYGEIIRSEVDQRPSIEKEYLHSLYTDFRLILSQNVTDNFNEIVSDTSTIISFAHSSNPIENILYITNKDLNLRNRHISGPLTLISKEKLTINSSLKLDNHIQILSNKSIIIKGKVNFENVLFYSPENIIISNPNYFEGQVFSENSIQINRNSRLDYPSVLVVYTEKDTGSIQLYPGSNVSGSIIYLTEKDTLLFGQYRGKIVIHENAQLNGLIYSDNFTTLSGHVNGTVITDRFYFYYSPTNYFNWINGATIDREAIKSNFKLPIFFKSSGNYLTPLYFR